MFLLEAFFTVLRLEYFVYHNDNLIEALYLIIQIRKILGIQQSDQPSNNKCGEVYIYHKSFLHLRVEIYPKPILSQIWERKFIQINVKNL